ncbi:MAG: TIGR02597 family protein [Flavobacteriia bacterium]|nr:TIGR02597 family protein [Flavobacteriia bacterium]
MKSCQSLVCLLSITIPTFSLLGQSTVSTPIVGFNTLNVRAKAGANNALSFISLNLTRSKAYSGLVGTKSLNGSGQTVITFSASSFNANQFNATTNRHYFQVKSGANSGLNTEVVGTTANSIILADNLDAVLENGITSFDIIPYWTLSTAFPAGAGLKTGTSATAADNLTIIEVPSGVAQSYFYNSTANQWRKGVTDSSHVVIPPGAGLLVTRKDATSVGVVISGQVPVGPTQADIVGGTSTAPRLTYVSNPYPIASKTLATSGLYTGNSNTGLVGGTSATAADNVTIYDPATGLANSYFYNTTAGQWRKGVTDSSNVVIPEGSAIVISRKANRGAFEWYIPQPAF